MNVGRAYVLEEFESAIRFRVCKIVDKYGQNLSKTAAALKAARNTVSKYL